MQIVKIDSVPVLQVGCRAGSELELRGGGGKDLLINFDTTDSRFDFHFLKYHPDHYISLFERFCSPGGDWLNSYTISRSSLDPLKQPHYKAAYNGSYPVENQ